jgi:hypothetical protein
MAKLKNIILEKMKKENRISYIPKEVTHRIHVATTEKMEKYSREYSKKEMASRIAASKVLLTS